VRHEHEPAGDVPGGNDVRGGGAQLLIDLHAPCVVSPASDLHEALRPGIGGVECRDLGSVRVLPDDGVLKMNAFT
jgi:hypothetical protein